MDASLEYPSVCPYINESEPRCAAYLSMRRLSQAMEFCADLFENCPLYRSICARQAQNKRQADHAVVAAG